MSFCLSGGTTLNVYVTVLTSLTVSLMVYEIDNGCNYRRQH